MWLLITFIIIWAISPGPVVVMTLHETRKNGLKAGVAVSAGATMTAALMVLMALVLHIAGFSTILESDNMMLIERVGALGIIGMGLYAGYKSLLSDENEDATTEINSTTKFGFMQGMLVMATYIPQALIYYNMIVPQTIEAQSIITAILILGILKVTLIFGWHSAIAVIANRTKTGVATHRFGKFFEVATACLLMGLGMNILI